MTDTMTHDRILFYCSAPAGMMDVSESASPTLKRRIADLAAEGKIELRERTVEVPEDKTFPESCKAVAMFDTWSARTVVTRTWHVVR